MFVQVYLSLLIFLTIGVLANANNLMPASEGATVPELTHAPVIYYDINANLTLNCSLTSNDSALAYSWKKNKQTVEVVPELNERYTLENEGASFKLSRAVENDFGTYSCSLGDQEMAWEVHGRPVAHLPENSRVIEGQKLKLQCKVTGKPYPAVTWTYQASEDSDMVPLVKGGRVTLKKNQQGIENASLVMASAKHADAGIYSCHVGDYGSSGNTTMVVRDMYAAVWPFLGICAEVFVVAIIFLLYDRHRNKQVNDDPEPDPDMDHAQCNGVC